MNSIRVKSDIFKINLLEKFSKFFNPYLRLTFMQAFKGILVTKGKMQRANLIILRITNKISYSSRLLYKQVERIWHNIDGIMHYTARIIYYLDAQQITNELKTKTFRIVANFENQILAGQISDKFIVRSLLEENKLFTFWCNLKRWNRWLRWSDDREEEMWSVTRLVDVLHSKYCNNPKARYIRFSV